MLGTTIVRSTNQEAVVAVTTPTTPIPTVMRTTAMTMMTTITTRMRRAFSKTGMAKHVMNVEACTIRNQTASGKVSK